MVARANWTRCIAGEAAHPVFVALRGTARTLFAAREPFSDLITAFEQDQTVTRYRNWDELFGYCRYSANPVGRLVLYLCGYSDAERQACRMPPAPRCNWRTSGRTSPWISRRTACTFRSM